MPSNEHVSTEQLEQLRTFLVSRWIAWGAQYGKPVTEKGEGMCRFTAVFLKLALGRGWQFSGGYPDMYDPVHGWIDNPKGGGFQTASKWEAHHWVTNGKVIIDLTASQFGEAPILQVPVTDPRFRTTLRPYQVTEALRDVRGRATQWHKDWKNFSQSAPTRTIQP